MNETIFYLIQCSDFYLYTLKCLWAFRASFFCFAGAKVRAFSKIAYKYLLLNIKNAIFLDFRQY